MRPVAGLAAGSDTGLGAYLPSPSQGTWYVGPFPLRAYALCILAGVAVAAVVTNRRWVARGGVPGTATDLAVWAVPAGLIGARLYHVATDWPAYFGPDRTGEQVWEVWRGGLGIPGGILGGALGAWAFARRNGIRLPALADALAVGLPLAQAIGRLGNWFNQELYGRATTLPWGLEIDPEFRPVGSPGVGTYHPTFLYEALWNVGVAALVAVADRRFRLGHGRAFALYLAGYAVGRSWVEALRIDPANTLGGLRINNWTALVAFVGAVVYLVLSRRLRPGREDPATVQRRPAGDPGPGAGSGPGGSDGPGSGPETRGGTGVDPVASAAQRPPPA